MPNIIAGEECDDVGFSPACDPDCTLAVCGDGVENNNAGEYCDDGNLEDGDGCTATCTNEEVETSEGGEESSSGGGTSEGGETTAGEGETTGTDVDSTGGGETAADSSGGESGGVSVTASATDSDPVTASASDTNGESSTGTTGGSDSDGGGCGCTTDDTRNRRDSAWFVLTLLGLGALTRRRRD